MRKIADFIVERRLPIFIIMLALTLVCGLLALRVGINTDMTKYLPDDSQMKVGVDIMDKEFPESDTDSSIRVMFTGLNEEQKTEVLFTLQKIKYVSSVEYEPDSEDFNKNDKTLFLVKTDFDYGSDEIKSIEKELNGISGYDMKWQSNSVESIKVPPAVLLCCRPFDRYSLCHVRIMDRAAALPRLYRRRRGSQSRHKPLFGFRLGTRNVDCSDTPARAFDGLLNYPYKPLPSGA